MARRRSHSAPGQAWEAISAAKSVDTPSEMAGFESGSVDTSTVVAGFDGPGSVDTPGVVAGFGGHSLGRPPRLRTAIPAARK